MRNREIPVGCLGALVMLAIVVVFGSESILAVMRKRDLSASIGVIDATTAAITPQPGSTPTLIPPNATIAMLPDGAIVVHLSWIYKIGPRFPITNITTTVKDSNNNIILTDTYKIDCGSETLDCSRSVDRVLRPKNTWTAGTYLVEIVYTNADLPKAFPLASQAIKVD
jgi:hypothetical protein